MNPRRERFRGQDVLVFDFEPNPEFKPHKMAEKVVHELAGVIWIDEKAHDVARLEAYFVGDFKFAGGVIANLQKGTSFTFEQAFVNNEVWLPTYEEAHVGVRVLLVKGFKINAVTRYSDYKKFNVESVASIGKPKSTDRRLCDQATPPRPTAVQPRLVSVDLYRFRCYLALVKDICSRISLVERDEGIDSKRRRTLSPRNNSDALNPRNDASPVAGYASNPVMNTPRPNPSLTAREILGAWGKILSGKSPMLSIEITRECPLSCPGCYAYGDAHLGGGKTLEPTQRFPRRRAR